MRALQDALDDVVRDVPRMALARIVERKLLAAGLKAPKGRVRKVVQHFLSENKEPFLWEDGGDQDVSLEITEKDFGELRDLVDRTFKVVEAQIENVSDVAATKILHSLKAKWSKQHALEVQDLAGFHRRLEKRWGRALGLLRMLVTIARELPKFTIEAGSNHENSREVFLRLHARACQVAAEIVTLLENGFADGAMARWRTLHEIGIVAAFLLQAGDQTIERYEAFGVVEAWRNLQAFERCREELGYEELPMEVHETLKAKFEAAIARYGRPFGKSYGWAAAYLDNVNPTFEQIEAAVDRSWQRSHYKLASYNVHAGPFAAYTKLGLLGGDKTLIAGPSNAGLHEPCQNTAYTLTHVSTLLCGQNPTLDQMIAVKVMSQLTAQIPKASAQAERRLQREHNKNQKKRGQFG